MSDTPENNTTTSEFEDTPVPKSHLKDSKSFWGMYAGEHTAGTEFMIGPLFVAWGVGAFDLIVGLLIGNILAVLSWRYICAPIATDLRMTLYKTLENICGNGLVKIYNLANGIFFCFLAGAMITVSATAVGVPFEQVVMPSLGDLYPTGPAWILIVLVVGLVVAFVAAFGYNAVARLSTIAAPWMILIFIACGLVTLPKLNSMELNAIWTGVPVGDLPKLGLWHVIFFAWLANAAMHIGMSDLSILRYAKKSSYGWASSAGMFLGHYIAWISASLLFALAIQRYGDSASSAPGPMVYDAIGVAGLICVVIAGWTTANPTIYRAGLAFQAIMPKLPRFGVTLAAGLLATAAGLFPAFAMKLLGFVGIYGTILAPVGAIIFVEYYLIRKLKLQPEYARENGQSFNMAALYAYAIPVVAAIIYWLDNPAAFKSFATVPVWIACGLLYIGFSFFFQKGRSLAGLLSIIGLIGSIIPPVLYSFGAMGDLTMKLTMLVAVLIWFMAFPLYLNQSKSNI